MRRSKLHRVNVRGVGRLSVSGKLPRYTKTVLVNGKRRPITKQNFIEAWALSQHTGRSFKELLAERITLPKLKLSPYERYVRDVEFGLGSTVSPERLLGYYDRGWTPEQAVSMIGAEARAREKEKKERMR